MPFSASWCLAVLVGTSGAQGSYLLAAQAAPTGGFSVEDKVELSVRPSGCFCEPRWTVAQPRALRAVALSLESLPSLPPAEGSLGSTQHLARLTQCLARSGTTCSCLSASALCPHSIGTDPPKGTSVAGWLFSWPF